ncbi:unnamed protein product (macronuclear) [Paramecium tetraurelia]|uniref:Transmembrane protein n=1 Tax=Paramecium tetraurelia TaxID=5888 RepID=A0BI20_PARTE|nr:uncharacterized protein GSPATT00029223001 [Paramecium tetraurelia]CAK58187.1 unnamed protein product [Paramecium tetraurelia]|eukprot:XP_001425585.1 hypothetical protein (macronuclear) [Paramecium tetraurelia strain d4-2]
MNNLKNLDLFGVPLVYGIDQRQSKYKSVLGGTLSLFTFLGSFAYAIWIFYLWQTKQMNPKISNSRFVSDYSLLDLKAGLIRLYYWQYDQNLIDPFQTKILLPLVIYNRNNKLTEPSLINETSVTSHGFTYIPKIELGFSKIDGEIYTSEEMYIEIVKCSEIYLQPNEKCASPELSEKFFKQSSNIIVLQIYSTTLDSRDGSEQNGLQELYIQIEESFCYTMNTFLQTNLYELQDYFLFGTSRYKEYISGAVVQTQTSSINYCYKAFNNDALSLVYLGMNGNQMKTIFEYPRAGDILANIGSIVSLLFMIKYIIIVLNQNSLNQMIIAELISFYYPEFKSICITRNWRQKITMVKINEKQVVLEEFLKFYDKAKHQMHQKLNYLNLLYEISRLYFIIRSSKYRGELFKSHSVGIKMNLNTNKDFDVIYDYNSISSAKQKTDNFLLNEDDADIISLTRRKIQINLDFIPDEIINENDFYNANKIV